MGRTRDGRAERSNLDGERELRTKNANDPPRKSTRKEKGKGIATSSQADARQPPRHSGYGNTVTDDLPDSQAPWPRIDGTPFSGSRIPLAPSLGRRGLVEDSSYKNKQKGDGWARFNSICYNGLLSVQISPTRFLCPKMLRDLGIFDEALAMLKRMGLGSMATKQYPMYPELVRQFLASCEIYYDFDGHERASAGCLTYIVRGITHEISFIDLCRLYGFDEDAERIYFPGRHGFRQNDRLWHLIGAGPAEPRSMKLASIRNPVLRIIAKALGLTLFCKAEPGALRLDELYLLHLGLPEFAHSIYTDILTGYYVNFGAVFATLLTERKFRGLDGPSKGRQEVCGSLLTPIFRHHGIDFGGTEVVTTHAFLDMQHLIQARWIASGKWKYTGLDGNAHSITLPSEYASLTSMDNLRFDPSLDQVEDVAPLQTRKRRNIQRGTDEAGPSSGPPPPQPMSYMPSLPPYQDEHDISPFQDTWSENDYRKWQHRSFRKLHDMIAKVWGALSCTRDSGAVPPSSQPTAGLSPEDAGEDTEEAEEDTDEEEDSSDAPGA